MSMRSVRNSSANWRSLLLGSLRRSAGISTWSRRGVFVFGMLIAVPMTENAALLCHNASAALHCIQSFGRDRLAAGPQHDLFQPGFGRFELGFAMAFQSLATLIQGDGVFQIDLTLLQPGDDAFQLFESGLKAHFADGRCRPLCIRCGNDCSPT